MLRNAFLLVAAALELAEALEDEQQQQEQNEQQLRRGLHPCEAETVLYSVAPRSGCTAPRRGSWQRGQTEPCRTGRIASVQLASCPEKYSAIGSKHEQSIKRCRQHATSVR